MAADQEEIDRVFGCRSHDYRTQATAEADPGLEVVKDSIQISAAALALRSARSRSTRPRCPEPQRNRSRGDPPHDWQPDFSGTISDLGD
jgi:hypothetical protein